MSAFYLMRKGEATMNVPPAKLQQYLGDGWVVISEPDAEVKPAAAKQAPDEPEAVSVEEAAAKLGGKSKKG